MKDMTNAIKGSKRSWKRANRLTEIANTGQPMQARKFLGIHKDNGYNTLLDGSSDKRSLNVRDMIQEFKKYTTTNPLKGRKSQGDPTKPPRAGAPTKYRPGKRKNRKNQPNPANIPGDLLFDLRAAQKKHEVTPTEMIYCIDLLSKLCDE